MARYRLAGTYPSSSTHVPKLRQPSNYFPTRGKPARWDSSNSPRGWRTSRCGGARCAEKIPTGRV